jgi:putative FmdB family regulatory protein
MPIYEYACTQCKNEFEVRVPFSQTNFTQLCPKCYSATERLTSSFACKTGGNLQATEKPFRQEMKKK